MTSKTHTDASGSPSRHHSTPIEDYALLSDLQTGPLVSREGSIDWLCLPRFDSPAVFTSLLGTPDDGRWKLSVRGGMVEERRYVKNTLIVETIWACPTGRAKVTDFLPPSSIQADVIRMVECLEGEVTVTHDLRVRFSYARALPWFSNQVLPSSGEQVLVCKAGPDGLLFRGPRLFSATSEDLEEGESRLLPRLVGDFQLSAGDKLDWSLTWFPSWQEVPEPVAAEAALTLTTDFWQSWIDNLAVDSPWAGLVERSLLVLRALTHSDTGGIVAAPTSSLPEDFGGERNWDYRYTWLRDAALTVEVMASHGFVDGALDWRNWLLRAVAGDVENLQIMYGLGGERELDEKELTHLKGYAGSTPVRVGNGAAGQYQADVVGEVMLALARLRDSGYEEDEFSWGLQKRLLDYQTEHIHVKDHGIWEMRGLPRFFTHGRVMMWAAFNEGIRAVELHGLDGDVESWRFYRDRLAEEILEHGFNEELGTFTQFYGGTTVDASLLQLSHTRFIAADDARMKGTVAAIEQELVDDHGYVYRYRTEGGVDGLQGGESPFLICTFWLIEQYAASGRLEEAEEKMNMVTGVANDLGLLAEEYDPINKRLAGNFPQAFSHLALIRAADAISRARLARGA
ncbi:glycoside hydrolase family 15 protein [Corynebacterium vitaeruminis]|uniref:Glycoside hydrolase 15-related protein n=1 Tax=Corynebacterium vitaeruminis DSM 20294 TaxID=1224164 RepID=W5Y3R9_9CORY|nr:glycoside hydrolase family 15 protein [Corynebacterium vitaeruminis]AHI23881.1 glycoside hydrolase 15-related protein [Corynebacterium vitaeruminis DSM 20294]